MEKPELTLNDVNRAVVEELACEVDSESVDIAMEKWAEDHGVSIEFLSELTGFIMSGMRVMVASGVATPIALHSSFANVFMLGWVAGKTFDEKADS